MQRRVRVRPSPRRMVLLSKNNRLIAASNILNNPDLKREVSRVPEFVSLQHGELCLFQVHPLGRYSFEAVAPFVI